MLTGVQLALRRGQFATSPVPREVADALVQADVTAAAGQRSGFQLRFALARDGALERELLPSGYFDPPARFILSAIVGGVPTTLMDGIAGQLDVAQSGDAGGSTLTVSGSDLSQLMDQIDLSGVPMPAMPPVARVAFILMRYAPWGLVPLVIPSVTDVPPNPLRQIPAQQGTDFAYVSQLADEAGYVFYVEPTAPGAGLAYWGPEIRVGPAQAPLRVNMGPSSNVDALSFTFDGLRKTLFAAWFNNRETHVSIPVPLPAVNPLTPPNGPRVPPPLKFTQLGQRTEVSDHDSTDASAKFDVATTIVRGLARAAQSANVVQASGSLDVRRYGRLLQPRRLVNVQGAGLTFDGEYFVASVTTTLRRGALTQSFALERNALEPFRSTVPVP